MTRRPSQLVRRLRLFMQIDPGPFRGPADFRRAAVGVVWLARFYYLFIFFMMNTKLHPSRLLEKGAPIDPLWPIGLLNDAMGTEWVEQAYGMPLIPVVCSILGLIPIVFPGFLIGRLGIFLYLFTAVALQNSHGAINHGSHFFVYVGFALLFLPPAANHPDRMSRKDAMGCIMVFWFAQSIPLLAYSLAGFWKIWGSGFELLASDGFIRILLDRTMTDTLPVPPLVPFAVQHAYLSQFLLLGVIYIQISAIFALFRPHLHRPLGVALILFHLGTDWLLNIRFNEFIVIIGILMVFSPFSPGHFSWFNVARSLPLLGIPFRPWAVSNHSRVHAEKAWLVYDGECPGCKHYALHLDVKEATGELVLVNAREGGALVEEIKNLPYDLNDGMVLKMDGRYYFGSDALHVLALLSEKRSVFGIVNRLLFSSRVTARIAYPLLQFGRRVLLRAKGISPIES